LVPQLRDQIVEAFENAGAYHAEGPLSGAGRLAHVEVNPTITAAATMAADGAVG